MTDGPGRRLLKAIARCDYAVNLAASRALARLRGDRPHQLAGACRRCARCCEAPAIQVGAWLWHSRRLSRAFLWWQDRVNGFVLTGRDAASRSFVFRCTHFDPSSRSCDSYGSRPGMCRDYPRALLWQARPELFPECGYRAVPPNAAALLAAIEAQPLTPAQREKLVRGLGLEPPPGPPAGEPDRRR